MADIPVSRTCPACGGQEYTLRKPKAFVAFADDRECKACSTRYSPPTPLWAGIVFLLCGLALPFLGFVLIALLFNPFSVLGLVCEGAFCVFAVAVFIGGIRQISNSAK